MAYKDVVAFHEQNQAELTVLNKRMNELRAGLEKAFDVGGGCSDLYEEYMENDFELSEYDNLVDIVQSYGMGVSEEGDYIWVPSTRTC